MQKDEIKERIETLEHEVFKFFPQQYIKDFIKTANDIVSHKQLLQSAFLDESSLEYLVDLMVDNVQKNRRFKRVASIKVLKQLIKKCDRKENFQTSLARKLFYLYRHFIFSDNEAIQWAVSIFIKDVVLDDADVLWLIDNHDESEHIINRLLRYPVYNTKISKWAERVYKNGDLLTRQSEVIAILISDEVPNYISVNSDVLMWAIYHSKSDTTTKEQLILSHLDFAEYAGALEVAQRLHFSSVASTLLSHYMKVADAK